MKIIAIVLCTALYLLPLTAQDGDQVFVASSTERDTIFALVPQPMLSIGLTGGVAFISPDNINDHIERNNSAYNTTEYPISRPAQWGLWISYRPKNLPTFLTLRGELLSSVRSYSFVTNITQDDPNVVASVASTSKHSYTVLPFTIGTGSVIYKTVAKAEIGFMYSLAWMTQETVVPGYTNSTTTYEGEGYGFRVNLQQTIPIEHTFSITMDVGYRFLVIDEFRDATGVAIKNTEMDYSGIMLSFGASYGF